MNGSLAIFIYRASSTRVQDLLLNLIKRTEGGELYSPTLRRIFREVHGVDIGLYTHGSCFQRWAFDRDTKIGRYGSMASGVRAMNANHRMDFKSTHAFFFNPELRIVAEDHREPIPLNIGNDVWMGHNAIVMPNVQTIGDGAVVAAGAVVNKDIPPYAIVVGNPARVVRFRFSPDVIGALLEEKWWEKPIEKLELAAFTRPFAPQQHPSQETTPAD